MRLLRLTLVSALPFALIACDDEPGPTIMEPDPVAAVHWVNASPDVGAIDIRPIDIVTNAGLFGAGFGAANANAQPILAGTRTIRVFRANSPDILWEGTHNFVEGQRYTFIVHGPANALKVDIINDNPPSPGSGNVAVRAVMLGVGLGNVDVYVGTEADGLPAASPAWTNVGYSPTGTDFKVFPAGPLRIAAVPAGAAEPFIVANQAMPAGSPPTNMLSGIPGVTQPGTAITAIIIDEGRAPIYLNHRRPD